MITNRMTLHMNAPALASSRRLLIVDDIAEVRADLRTLLTLAGGIEIVGEATDGLQAILLAQSTHPDVILMDLEMPVMDGYTAARRIKSILPACRVIALTVHYYPEARLKALQSGADALVVKGASLANLLEEIFKKE